MGRLQGKHALVLGAANRDNMAQVIARRFSAEGAAVTVAGRGPRDSDTAPMREGFTATEILRETDGQFVITLSPEVQPGNWLPMPRPRGPVRLALRLYDTPVAASAGSLDRSAVPAITRTGCAA
mgnify:CR=1 FL=1